MNDQFKDWVKRLQEEKKELFASQEQVFEENTDLKQRIEKLQSANAALLARNKNLELMSDNGRSIVEAQKQL